MFAICLCWEKNNNPHLSAGSCNLYAFILRWRRNCCLLSKGFAHPLKVTIAAQFQTAWKKTYKKYVCILNQSTQVLPPHLSPSARKQLQVVWIELCTKLVYQGAGPNPVVTVTSAPGQCPKQLRLCHNTAVAQSGGHNALKWVLHHWASSTNEVAKTRTNRRTSPIPPTRNAVILLGAFYYSSLPSFLYNLHIKGKSTYKIK